MSILRALSLFAVTIGLDAKIKLAEGEPIHLRNLRHLREKKAIPQV